MNEALAIAAHLNYRAPGPDGHWWSGFNEGLRDARRATGRDVDGGTKLPAQQHGSWLGALGYLVLLEQIGRCFKPRSRPTSKAKNAFRRALAHFTPLPEREIKALYALRCAFAHDYSLYNEGGRDPLMSHYFIIVANADAPLLALPSQQWDGNARARAMATVVNLERLGDLVESIVTDLAKFATSDSLDILLPGGSKELLSRYSLFRKTT